MATLTIADLDNGKHDLETVDAVANSQADTTTTRYGDSVLTLAGTLRRLGWQAPVPYAPGLLVESSVMTVEKEGIVYRPDPALVPFTTGAWNPDQWRVVQGGAEGNEFLYFNLRTQAVPAAVTAAEGQHVYIAADSEHGGRSTLNVVNSGVLVFLQLAPAQVVSDRMAALENAMPLQAALYGVGNSADSAAALQTLLTLANGAPISLPAAIRIDTLCEYAGPVNIEGNGCVIDVSRGGRLFFKSNIAAIPNLSANIAAGTTPATFSAAHGLIEEDVFLVSNPTDFSFSAHRSYYKDGCMFQVDKVNSPTSLNFYGVAPSTFTSASVKCYKLTGAGVSMRNFFISVGARTDGAAPVAIEGHKRVDVRYGIVGAAGVDTALSISRCYNISAEVVGGSAKGGNAYPLVLGNSQRFTVRMNGTNSLRHAFAMGGDSSVGNVPMRDGIISGAIFYNRPGAGSADIHGNAANIQYVDCIMNSGVDLGGKDVSLKGCKIYSRDLGDGVAIFGSEIIGGTYNISDCELYINRNGVNTGFGMIHLAGTVSFPERFVININNITVKNIGGSTSATASNNFLQHDQTATQPNGITINVNGVTFVNLALRALIGITASGGLVGSNFVAVDEITTDQGQLPLFEYSGVATHPKYRLPRLTGRLNLNTSTTVAVTIGPTQTLKYVYPVLPAAFVNTNGIASVNLPALGGIEALSTSTITPKILSSTLANFSAVSSIPVSWGVEIKEF